MKRLSILTAAFLSLSLPLSAFASTTSFTPNTFTVQPGQSFNVTVLVSPSETDYTAKIALTYPASLLSVSSFSFSSGWLPLSQPGYDSIDNSSGVLVKTAGYSGGFSTQKVFGTVTFVAKTEGSATIVPSGSTQILDANNTNTFASGGRATVAIEKPFPLRNVPAPTPVTSTNTSNPTRSPLTSVKKVTPKLAIHAISTPVGDVFSEPSTTSPVIATTTQQTATAILGTSTKSKSLPICVALVVASFGLGVVVGRRQKFI